MEDEDVPLSSEELKRLGSPLFSIYSYDKMKTQEEQR